MIRAFVSKYAFALMFLAAATVTSPERGIAAQDSTASQTRAIPSGVFELLVGGSWEHEKASGYYRAIALGAGKTGEEYAEVWIQWISVEKTTATILKNIPIKEVSKLNLPSLGLAMDVEESGNVILVVTHYDEDKDETQTYEFRASEPGAYKPLEAEIASE